jgi:lipoprotein-releasing system permease protein
LLFPAVHRIFQSHGTLPFPVKIVGKNYLIVALTASVFGIAISWFFSKISKEYITKN